MQPCLYFPARSLALVWAIAALLVAGGALPANVPGSNPSAEVVCTRITLELSTRGTTRVNGMPLGNTALKAFIAEQIRRSEDPGRFEVIVLAPGETEYGIVQTVFDDIRAAGCQRIKLRVRAK